MTRKRTAADAAKGSTREPVDGTSEGTADGMPPPGVWPLETRSATTLQQWTESQQHRFVALTVERNADRRTLLLAIGQAFSFPAWYGANLDALYDCLTDLPEQGETRGCVVLIAGLPVRHRQQPVLDVFGDAARHLAQHGYALRVFVVPSVRGG